MEGSMSIFRLILLISLPLSLIADVTIYKPNKYIKQKVWNEVAPYLLPPDHPAKETLDTIFSKKRASLNIKSMEKAGFDVTKPRQWTHLVLARHPKLKGYIIKLYLDAQRCHKNLPDHYFWVKRLEGVHKIGEMIATYNWSHQFNTPKKWIYPLPSEPKVSKGYHRKRFILIEEDMNLCKKEENTARWKGPLVTSELLDDLYVILEQLGLKDCAKPDNIPFSTDGRIAFIDTQTHNAYPVTYSKLTSYLAPKMARHWKALTKNSKK